MLRLGNAFDLLFAAFAGGALVAVLQTFIIGRHFIIPTVILAFAVLCGNLAWYGLHGQTWAKRVLFWCGVLLTAHCAFALFWAKRYRELLGDAFEPVCFTLLVILAWLCLRYARSNGLFVR
jgi:hypothetical protein